MEIMTTKEYADLRKGSDTRNSRNRRVIQRNVQSNRIDLLPGVLKIEKKGRDYLLYVDVNNLNIVDKITFKTLADFSKHYNFIINNFHENFNNNKNGYNVYFLYKEDVIIYIGSTNALNKRIYLHSRNFNFNNVFFISAKNKKESLHIEEIAIKAFTPAFNQNKTL